MKMKWLFLIAVLLHMGDVFAQKSVIDSVAIKNWERLGSYDVSNDGKYVWHEIVSDSKGTNLIVCDATGNNRKEFKSASNAKFSEDSKYVFFESRAGVQLFNLTSGTNEIISGANNYDTPREGNGRWLAYSKGDTTCLRDVNTKETIFYTGVKNHIFSKQGNALMLMTDSSIKLIELPSMKQKVIFHGKGINSLIFDDLGRQAAWSVMNNKTTNIFIYQLHTNKCELLVSDTSEGIPSNCKISRQDIRFSENGKQVYFKLSVTLKSQDSNIYTRDVDIWNYKDIFLPTEQADRPLKRYFIAVISTQSKKVVQLENDNTLLEEVCQNFALLKSVGNYQESYWRKSQLTTYRIVSLVDGKSPANILIPIEAEIVKLSPAGQYLTFLNTKTHKYCCIEIASGITREISIAFELYPVSKRETLQIPFHLVQWIENDRAIIIKDEHDIWQLDPNNKIKPICLTEEYGKRKNIVFSIIPNSVNQLLRPNDLLLLSAFDQTTKFNGFAMVNISKSRLSSIRLLGPYVYYLSNIITERLISPPKKAKNAEVYILHRQSVDEEPNIFLTRDFINLQPISSLKYHKNYKWHNSKLVHWKIEDGSELAGILYCPIDIDTAEKHPIIFTYYEERSHELFKYNDPSFLGVNLNLAWYLSKGYIVFVPDIFPLKGATGESALNSVVGAANFLIKKYPWIDKRRMGLQGHSHGGYITNYIVTHSNLFSAAQSGAGYSDFIRGYGELGFGGGSLQFMQEIGQNNLGTTPWLSPTTYIKNSPVFFVDNVETPLLLMHNKDDGAVQFGQSVEFFTALRRMEKKVWLLQYDGEGHHIWDFNRAYDFLTRQQQFFDHYLKGVPAPIWMVEGIPLKHKGIKSGLQLDPLNRTP